MRLRFELDTGKAEEHPVTVVNNAPHVGRIDKELGRGPVQGGPDPEGDDISIPSESVRQSAWAKVCEGRQKWLDGIADEDIVKNDRRNYWIGGALAIWCEFTGEDPAVAHNRLLKEMPQPGHDNSMLAPGELPLQPEPRPRSKPHPGAQRVVGEDDPVMEEAESPIPEASPEVLMGDGEDQSLAPGGLIEGTRVVMIDEGATEDDVDEDVREVMLKGVEAASMADGLAFPLKPHKATPPEISVTQIEDRT